MAMFRDLSVEVGVRVEVVCVWFISKMMQVRLLMVIVSSLFVRMRRVLEFYIFCSMCMRRIDLFSRGLPCAAEGGIAMGFRMRLSEGLGEDAIFTLATLKRPHSQLN